MSRPIISGDLVDSAAALLLCQHESPFALPSVDGDNAAFECEQHLADAREAASKYLVACFTYAATAVDDAD